MTRWPSGGAGILVLVLVAGTTVAAIVWTSTSSVDVGAVDPPVQFTQGDNSDDRRYLRSFVLSTNQTSFTTEIQPRLGADVHVTDMVRLHNQDATSRTITLTGSTVSDIDVQRFSWRVMDGSTLIATIDHLSDTPSVQFTMASGATFEFDLRIDLADTSSASTQPAFELQLEVG